MDDLPDRLCLPLCFDPPSLQRDLAEVARAGWTDHFVQQNYEGQWSAIALRAPAGETHPIRLIYSDPTAECYVDAPALDRAPYLRSVLASFACPLLSVRLMRLSAGSRIKPHHDHDLSAQFGMARLHIPIATGPEVEFVLAGRAVAMAPGECWYLRLSEVHSVHNRGDRDRVHLVIDAKVDDWLASLLRRAAEA